MTEGRSAPAMDWPKTADEATADRMIVCAAHHAVFLDARHDDLYAAVPWHEPAESQERTAAIRRWANAIGETVKAAQVVALRSRFKSATATMPTRSLDGSGR